MGRPSTTAWRTCLYLPFPPRLLRVGVTGGGHHLRAPLQPLTPSRQFGVRTTVNARFRTTPTYPPTSAHFRAYCDVVRRDSGRLDWWRCDGGTRVEFWNGNERYDLVTF